MHCPRCGGLPASTAVNGKNVRHFCLKCGTHFFESTDAEARPAGASTGPGTGGSNSLVAMAERMAEDSRHAKERNGR